LGIEKYDDKNSMLQASKGAFIAAALVKDLLTNERLLESSIELWNLGELYDITGVSDFFVEPTGHDALVLAREPESLFKIDLKNGAKFASEPVCLKSGMFAVSEREDRVFVPCFSDNKVISLTKSSIRLIGVSGYYGRGPAFIAVDDAHKKIFVSYNNDGKVVVLDFDLAYLGHIFNEAPSDRTGS